MTAKARVLLLAVLLSLAACSPSPGAAGTTVTVDLDGRPFQLHVPAGYDEATRAPLVVLLHGYTSSAAEQEEYFQLTGESDRRGFLYAMPDGTTDREGNRFWNATAACCDFHGSGVDDSAYLARLVDTVDARYPVDPARVYFVGHSNGGFMALRMACEHADRVTAVVSLAGAATAEAARCAPRRPVSVLQIHGTADRTILYGGGPSTRPYPSAEGTVALWRGLDGCAGAADTSAPPLDLDAGLPGAETTVTAYHEGCRDGTRAELWSIRGGGHVPALTPAFAPAVAGFLLALASPAR
ncbi:extracellular catalytic domain type 1 short-chain-length polyhydroxyalkanoate depolymerase [Phytohabitans suffuscus]|uniref:Polyhydroxybutyrate depolymerase n=1 Tax=Phytohabitans suffuscus TaxID=624315 RepID=A0A6F8YY34_9ACTN|nr:alpha/beta fold hydrolase [Phytohabitans suffuscus]BCB90913.1 polyhydroxybutyrate depolymerase [Phytohabitans suffuscus]